MKQNEIDEIKTKQEKFEEIASNLAQDARKKNSTGQVFEVIKKYVQKTISQNT